MLPRDASVMLTLYDINGSGPRIIPNYIQCPVLMPSLGFPGGSAVKTLPANAGDAGSVSPAGDPAGRRAARPAGHSPGACALESHPQLLSPRALEPSCDSESSRCSERPAQRAREQPLLTATRAKPPGNGDPEDKQR